MVNMSAEQFQLQWFSTTWFDSYWVQWQNYSRLPLKCFWGHSPNSIKMFTLYWIKSPKCWPHITRSLPRLPRWILRASLWRVSEVPGRQHLRSARRHQLLIPRVRRGTFGARAFSVAGPTVWNSLPDCLRDPAVDSEQFRRDLKTYLFAGHSRR